MKKITPLRAIKAKCLDCCCGIAAEVRKCDICSCPLYPYKNGHKSNERMSEYSFITNSTLLQNTPEKPTKTKKKALAERTTEKARANRTQGADKFIIACPLRKVKREGETRNEIYRSTNQERASTTASCI